MSGWKPIQDPIPVKSTSRKSHADQLTGFEESPSGNRIKVNKEKLLYHDKGVAVIWNPEKAKAAGSASTAQQKVDGAEGKRSMSLQDIHTKAWTKVQKLADPSEEDNMRHYAIQGLFLKSLYKTGRLTDFVVTVKGKKFHTHKLVLTCRSKFFADMFRNKTRTAAMKITEVAIDDISPSSFKLVLDYYYGGNLDITAHNVTNIREAAAKLGTSEIVQSCDEFVSELFSFDSILPFYQMARSSGMEDLQNKACAIICQNFKPITSSPAFLDLPLDAICDLLSDNNIKVESEIEVFRAALRWLFRDPGTRMQFAGKVMGAIRFTAMSQDELFECVDSAPFLMDAPQTRELILSAAWYQACIIRQHPSKAVFMGFPKPREGPPQKFTAPSFWQMESSDTDVTPEAYTASARASGYPIAGDPISQQKRQYTSKGGQCNGQDIYGSPFPELLPGEQPGAIHTIGQPYDQYGGDTARASITPYMQMPGRVPQQGTQNAYGQAGMPMRNQSILASHLCNYQPEYLLSRAALNNALASDQRRPSSDQQRRTSGVGTVIDQQRRPSSAFRGTIGDQQRRPSGQSTPGMNIDQQRRVSGPVSGTAGNQQRRQSARVPAPTTEQQRRQSARVSQHKQKSLCAIPSPVVEESSGALDAANAAASAAETDQAGRSSAATRPSTVPEVPPEPAADKKSKRPSAASLRASISAAATKSKVAVQAAKTKSKLSAVEASHLSTAVSGGGDEVTSNASEEIKQNIQSSRSLSSVFSASEADHVIALVGGIDPDVWEPEDTGRHFWFYDPLNDEWTRNINLPEGLNYHGVAALGPFIFVMGGIKVHEGQAHSEFMPIKNAYKYDTRTKVWSRIAKMKTPRMHLECVALDKLIYAIGGQNGNGQVLSSVECYNPQTDSWSKVADMNVARVGFAHTVFDYCIFTVGGLSETNRKGQMPVSTAVEMYDPTINKWEMKNPLPTPRCWASLCNVYDMLYLIGGATNSDVQGEILQNLATIDIYDPDSDFWEYITSLSEDRRRSTAAVAGGCIYIFGGTGTGNQGKCLMDVECYDTETETWLETIQPLPEPLVGVKAVAIRNPEPM